MARQSNAISAAQATTATALALLERNSRTLAGALRSMASGALAATCCALKI